MLAEPKSRMSVDIIAGENTKTSHIKGTAWNDTNLGISFCMKQCIPQKIICFF